MEVNKMEELKLEFILKNDFSGMGTTTEEAIEDYKNNKSEFFAYHGEDGRTNLVIADQLQYLFVTDLTIAEVNKQFSTLLELSINTVFDEYIEVTSPYFEVVNDKLVVYVYTEGRFRILIMDAANVTNIVMKTQSEPNPMALTDPNFIKKAMTELLASTDKAQTHEDLVQGVMARVKYAYNGVVLFGDMFFNNRYNLDSRELVDLFKKYLMETINPHEEPVEVLEEPEETVNEEPDNDIPEATYLEDNTED